MSKRISLLLSAMVCSIVWISSCSKGGDNTPTPTGPTKIDTMKYKITGVTDIELQPTDSVNMPIDIEYLSGVKGLVTIAVNNLPVNTSVGMEPLTETPPFHSVVRFFSNKATPGTYYLKLDGHTVAGTQGYALKLTIRKYDNDAYNIAGNYKEAGNCATIGAVNHNAIIEPNTTAPQRVTIKSIWTGAGTITVYADLDKVNHTVTIPSQTSASVVFSGSGTYTDTTMTIQYTITGPGVNDNCSTVLTRQ